MVLVRPITLVSNRVVKRFLYFYTLQAIEQKRWGSCTCLPHSSQGLPDFAFSDLVSKDWLREFRWTAILPLALYGCRIKQMELQVMRQRDGMCHRRKQKLTLLQVYFVCFQQVENKTNKHKLITKKNSIPITKTGLN